SGISATFYVVLTFVLCALLAGVTGLLITAQMGSGQTNLGGARLLLLSIAAAGIGGTSLRGGIGRAEIVGVSALFLSTLTNALNLLRINSKKELVVLGIVVVAAVALDSLGRGKAAVEYQMDQAGGIQSAAVALPTMAERRQTLAHIVSLVYRVLVPASPV